MSWSPDTYNKFKKERFAPFYDLIELIEVKAPKKVLDLGCGTGELTRLLADHLTGSTVLGIDSSEEMLEQSAEYSNENTRFECRSIQEEIQREEKWDLIFSHAALQWVDDHEKLFPSLIEKLSPGGQILVQVPSNQDHYSQVALISLASEVSFKEVLGGWVRQTPVLQIGTYADILFKQGGSAITVYEKVYPHIVKDAGSLYEWISGTALIPYMERLPEKWRDSFKEKYRKKLAEEFKDSPLFYPFKRILLTAVF
jgi:trans-aconitate 2-methyltransferase